MIWETNGGVYQGYPTENGEQSRMPMAYIGDRHIVTIGPNGSGKSRRLLLPNLARLTDWSMLVVDPKGELHAMTAEHRRRAGSEIIVLDPFGPQSTGFNPIASLPLTDDFPDDALGQAEAVIRIEGKEPHWAQAAQELVAAIIMYVRLVIPGGSFSDVRVLLGLTNKAMRELVNSQRFEYPANSGKFYPGMVEAGIIHNWEEIGIKAGRYGDLTPENREMLGVISTALTQTRWLDSRPVKRDLAGPPFDFTVMKEKPVTVYLILPARRLATHSTWLRLMIASVLQMLMKDTQRRKTPVLFMLDEYFAVAEGDGLPVISRNMAMMRGYGIKLWTVLQDLGQAERLYGDKGFESFIGNSGVLQSFAAQDLITSNYISERTGQRTEYAISSSVSRSHQATQGAGITKGVSVAQIPLPLMLPQDVRELDDGMSVLFSHKVKGTVLSYLPYPTELAWRGMKEICALDPAAG